METAPNRAEDRPIAAAQAASAPWLPWLRALVIIAAGAFVLSPVLKGFWTGDDDLYLLGNSLLQQPDRIWKAWFVPGSFIEYYPIEQTVQYEQWLLWGTKSPFYYLVTNLVLHLTSALLLWHLFSKLGLKLAWLGGLIFAIHPLLVDSVGSVSEFKNTLSLPPFILAMCFYLDYENSGKTKYYVLSLALFLVAMLCKITMDFFPIVILLYAWWHRGRITWADARASLPFFVISLVMGLSVFYCGSVYAQNTHYHSPAPVHLGGFLERMELVGLTLGFYFGHSFLPLHPMPYYPLWSLEPLTPWRFLPWLGIALVLIGCWQKRHDWGRPVLFGLAFFVLGLAPFLGIIEVTYMCLVWVSDHFLYIPIIGLIGLVLAGLERLGHLLPRRLLPAGIALVALAVSLLGAESYSYARLFVDREQLWRYNLQYNPDFWLLHYTLGGQLVNRRALPEAEQELDAAIRINPDFPRAYLTRALALYYDGRLSEAIDNLKDSVRIDPHFEAGRMELAFMLSLAHRYPEAIDHFQLALRDNPYLSAAHFGLGQALGAENRIPEAIAELEVAHRLEPANDKITQLLDQAKQYEASQAHKP